MQHTNGSPRRACWITAVARAGSRAAADLFGRIAQTLARECTNEPGIAEFRREMERSRGEALETAAGSCG